MAFAAVIGTNAHRRGGTELGLQRIRPGVFFAGKTALGALVTDPFFRRRKRCQSPLPGVRHHCPVSPPPLPYDNRRVVPWATTRCSSEARSNAARCATRGAPYPYNGGTARGGRPFLTCSPTWNGRSSRELWPQGCVVLSVLQYRSRPLRVARRLQVENVGCLPYGWACKMLFDKYIRLAKVAKRALQNFLFLCKTLQNPSVSFQNFAKLFKTFQDFCKVFRGPARAPRKFSKFRKIFPEFQVPWSASFVPLSLRGRGWHGHPRCLGRPCKTRD